MVRVTVIGGGVSAIGTAYALQELAPQCEFTFISEEFSPHTTGDGAAGLWGPFLIAGTPLELIEKWSKETWDIFFSWWKSGEAWGVSLVPGTVISKDSHLEEPWSYIPFGYQTLTQEECRKYGQDYVSGHSFVSFTAEASKFLPRLQKQISSRGKASFLKKRLFSLAEAADANTDLILNCCGISAKYLVPDPAMYPIRGQVMRVKAPWVNQFLCDDSEGNFSYIIPNIENVILGGTIQEGDWRLHIDSEDSASIWSRCSSLMPSLQKAELVREWVGLRPARRGGIRIEKDSIAVNRRKIPVVHNYGHSGIGVTVLWGTSQEAARLAAQVIHSNHIPVSRL